jgi:hypothetical protein
MGRPVLLARDTDLWNRLQERPLNRPVLVLLWGAGLYLLYVTVAYYLSHDRLGGDAHAYWLTGQEWYIPYEIAPNRNDAFLYSPAFAQLIRPLTWLPWPAFLTIRICAEASAFLWLLKPLGWRWALPLVLWCSPELVIGNILGFLGLALVFGIVRPWTWAAMFLTKPVFGLGSVWFAARREWGHLGLALASTALVTAVSVAFDPEAWSRWISFLASSAHGSTSTLLARAVIALVVVMLAARTQRPWLLPCALLVATPVFAGAPSLTILAAIPRLVRSGGSRKRTPSPSAAVPVIDNF